MYYLYFSISCLLTFFLMRRGKKKIWGITGSLVVWIAGAGIILASHTSLGSLGPQTEPDWLSETILFVVLLLGMSAKYLWDLIELRNEKNAKRTTGEPEVGLEFDFWDYVKPMLVSVIIFVAVTGMDYKLSRTTLLTSFQNGFFWQTVFRKKSAPTA